MSQLLISIVIGAAFVQAAPIGSALSDGVQLVYEAGGAQQAPWVYDSVRVVERPDFERCVRVARRSQAPRESCARADTLLERSADGTYAAVRPIGPGMRLEFRAASGNILDYTTGEVSTRRIMGGVEVDVVLTTILTRDPEGTLIRRLSEEYAPALLTAVRGRFEEPDGAGGWRSVQEFSLSEVRTAPPAGVPSDLPERVTGVPSNEDGVPGVPEELRTHAERSGWTELTPHDEVLAFYRALASHAPEAVRLRSIGTSGEGRELLAVTISRPGVAGPSDPVVRGRPIVFIGAQVHGNEQAGKEGLMLFARDLAAGELAELTERAVFVLVPQINPDAGEAGEWGTRTNPAGYNVNRDYSRLVNPESRAVVEEVLNPWQPHVTVDAHELTGAHYYDFFALHPSNLNTPQAVREMAAGPATDAVREAIEGAGYTYFPYHLQPSDPTRIPEEGISGAGYGIRILRNYGGARGAVSLLYESRREDDSRLRLEERARWQRIAMTGLARWVVENAGEVVAAVEEGRAETARLGARWDAADSIIVRTALEVSGQVAYRMPEMRALPDGSGYEPTGQVLDLEVPFRDRIVPVVARIRPVGYLIEAHRGDLAEELLRHGLEVERIEGPLELPVESFRVDSVAVASSTAEGYYERAVWTTTEERSVSLPRGGYLVRTTQPMAAVAFSLLEPEDVDSFASTGAFAAEKSVGGLLPVHRLRELPGVAGVLMERGGR